MLSGALLCFLLIPVSSYSRCECPRCKDAGECGVLAGALLCFLLIPILSNSRCECPRCKDAGECGVLAGALLCHLCSGPVLPPTTSSTQDWRCKKCSTAVPYKKVGFKFLSKCMQFELYFPVKIFKNQNTRINKKIRFLEFNISMASYSILNRVSTQQQNVRKRMDPKNLSR